MPAIGSSAITTFYYITCFAINADISRHVRYIDTVFLYFPADGRSVFADFIRNMEYLAIFAIGVYCLWAVDGKHICLAMVFAGNQSVYHLIFTLTKQEMTHEDNYRFSCLQQ